MDDAQLVHQVREGDMDAFNALMARWQHKIHGFVYRFFACSDDASEITQRTFIKAYESIHSLSDANKFGSWMYTIANRLCLDELKRAGRKRSTSLEVLKTAPQTEERTAAADQRLLRNEAMVLLHKALLQLPVEQRVVVIMKEYEGLKFHEIAEILEQPINTVKSRLYYGLKALRVTFDAWNITQEAFTYD